MHFKWKKNNLQPSQKNKIKCLNWKEDNLKKTKAANCVSWFLVILGFHRRTIFAKNWFCPVQKNPQKWFYVHLGRVMHINHRNYAQLSRNEVILSSTYFIASWKLEWEHFFFVYLFATCISYFFNIDLETTCIWKFCFVKFVFAWSMFVYTLFCIYVLG